MLFYDRSDGRRVRNLAPMTATIPYLMRGRNESAVYLRLEARLDGAEDYIREWNARPGVPRLTLFAVVIAAVARTLREKPELNRFVHRRVLYERRGIWISFFAAGRQDDASRERAVKLRFDEPRPLSEIAEAIDSATGSRKLTADEDEMRRWHAVPGGKALATDCFRFFDALNLAPRGMIEADPLYASACVANLGSIGLDAPYHHLYEWGTASVFVAIGRVSRRQGGGRKLDLSLTLDERVSQGHYFARAASLFRRLVENPALLEETGQADGDSGNDARKEGTVPS